MALLPRLSMSHGLRPQVFSVGLVDSSFGLLCKLRCWSNGFAVSASYSSLCGSSWRLKCSPAATSLVLEGCFISSLFLGLQNHSSPSQRISLCLPRRTATSPRQPRHHFVSPVTPNLAGLTLVSASQGYSTWFRFGGFVGALAEVAGPGLNPHHNVVLPALLSTMGDANAEVQNFASKAAETVVLVIDEEGIEPLISEF